MAWARTLSPTDRSSPVHHTLGYLETLPEHQALTDLLIMFAVKLEREKKVKGNFQESLYNIDVY